MGKYNRCLVCLLVVLLLVPTACSKLKHEDESSSATLEVTQAVTDGGEKASTEASVPELSILDNREQFDEEGVLWYIPNERIEEEGEQQILWFNGNLLVWGTGIDTDGNVVLKLVILSMETGEALYETALSNFDIPNVQVCEEVIAVTDWSDGDVRLLDKELQIIKEYQMAAEYATVYLSSDASKVYCFTQNEGVRITDIDTGDTKIVLENAANLFSRGCVDNIVSVTYTDRDTQFNFSGIVNLETGEAQNIPFSGTFFGVEYCNEVWLAGVADKSNTYYLGRAEHPNAFSMPNDNSILAMLNSPARLLATSYDVIGNSTITLYDVDGSFISECNILLERGGLFNGPVWSQKDGGYFFIVTESTGRDILLFWDLATPVAGEALQFEAAYSNDIVTGTVVPQELYDRADSISENFGVNVKIAEQCEELYDDFTVDKEFDEGYISSGLDALEMVLASYPEGFIEQLMYGDQKKIEIVLGGHLTKNSLDENSLGFTSFDGFAQEQMGRTIIVVDITNPGSLEQTLYHEMMHLIDNRLSFDAGIRENSVYSEEHWYSLNPEDFEYADSYNDIPMELYADGYDAWFIDIYSRTFAKEDKARIMEHAMVGNDWMYSASPGRLAKLEYLCECIRDAFDTTGWPEKTVWEETLERCK